MDPNYRILEIDIYGDLRKQQLFDLAKEYNITVPDTLDAARSRDLRQILATTKLAHRIAKNDNAAELVLKKVLNKIPLDQTQIDNFPDIHKFAELQQPIYDTPEFNENKPIYENVTLPQTPALDFVPYQPPPPPTLNNSSINRREHIYTQLSYKNNTLSHNNQTTAEAPPASPTSQPLTDNNIQQQTLVTCQSQNSNQNNYVNMAQENKPLIKATTYSGLESENCQEFMEKFELAARINAWKPETKIDIFQTHLANLPYKWFEIYKKEHDQITWNDLKSEFFKTFCPIAQIEDRQTILENRLQRKDETPTKFLFEITYLCQKVDPNMPEQKIMEYVINGLQPKFCTELLRMEQDSLNELRTNINKIEKQFYKQQKNSRRYNVIFHEQGNGNDVTTAKRTSEGNNLHYDDRLDRIEQAICNINLRPRHRRHKHDSTSEDDETRYERQEERRNYSEEDDGRRYSLERTNGRYYSEQDNQEEDYNRRRYSRHISPNWKSEGKNNYWRRNTEESPTRKWNEDRRSRRKYMYENYKDGPSEAKYDYYRRNASPRDNHRHHISPSELNKRNHWKKEDDVRATSKEDRRLNNKQHFSPKSRDNITRKYCHICSISNHETKECGFNLKNKKREASNKRTPCEHCSMTNHRSEDCYKKKSKNA